MRTFRAVAFGGILMACLPCRGVWAGDPASAYREASSPAAGVDTELVVYRVQEPGAPAYISRYLATLDYLRIDQGEQDTGYLLLDRKQGKIYDVSHDDGTVLVVEAGPRDLAPGADLELTTEKSVQTDAPSVAGISPVEVGLSADGVLCRSAVVLPGVLPQAIAAMRDYLRVLAYREHAVRDQMPPEMLRPCDRAVHIHSPDFALANGLPLQVWDDRGLSQQLLDFKPAHKVPEALFEVPADYRVLTLPGTALGD